MQQSTRNIRPATYTEPHVLRAVFAALGIAALLGMTVALVI